MMLEPKTQKQIKSFFLALFTSTTVGSVSASDLNEGRSSRSMRRYNANNYQRAPLCLGSPSQRDVASQCVLGKLSVEPQASKEEIEGVKEIPNVDIS